jgi:DNA-binding NtrC family response regulator
LAAAQESLQKAVMQQRFRADLYARLDGLTLQLPPLRDRIEDVPPLLSHFMTEERSASPPTFSANALNALCLYDWPFNVRELRFLARRLAVLHGDASVLRTKHLPSRVVAAGNVSRMELATSAAAQRPELDRFVDALRCNHGNVSRAARDAGISRMRAYRLMNANPELDVDAFRRSDQEPVS